MKAVDRLKREFADQVVSPDSAAFDAYRRDATEIDHDPDLVVLPETSQQVARLVSLADKHGIPVIARGAGTGFSGGAVASHGGVVVSLEKMNRIIEVDPVLRTATVEAGVITHDLDLAANKHGLFYPPDPASHKESTLGGNLAECAGGLRCVKYGVTKDYVVGLEYVDSGGTLRLAGSMSDAPGIFDIVSLLIGSEGTLGIVTKMRVELLPIPESRMTLLYAFTRESDAAEAVTAIRGAGVLPCVLEFMDAGAIAAAAQHLNLKELHKAAALLLVELDGVAAQVERDAVQVISIVRKLNPVLDRQTRDESEREDMWHIRRELSTAIKSLSKVKTSEDVCVPVDRFADLVDEIQRVAKSNELNTASFGHAGDGNLHVCFIIPELSPQNIQRMESAKTQLLRTTLNMGGTISGEHGIGFTKKAFLVDEVGSDVIELSSLIKKSFDPHGLFNPGKIF